MLDDVVANKPWTLDYALPWSANVFCCVKGMQWLRHQQHQRSRERRCQCDGVVVRLQLHSSCKYHEGVTISARATLFSRTFLPARSLSSMLLLVDLLMLATATEETRIVYTSCDLVLEALSSMKGVVRALCGRSALLWTQ